MKKTATLGGITICGLSLGGIAFVLSIAAGALRADEAPPVPEDEGANQISTATAALISFEDVAEREGIFWSGSRGNPAFSVSWLDFNNDGWPDLWVAPHGYARKWPKLPSLYLNQGAEGFTDIFDEHWIPLGKGDDVHGSTWVDFDNDSDPDLFASQGAQKGLGAGSKLFFVSDGRTLRDEAELRGLDYPLGRGRSSLWFDWDRDGLLDVLMALSVRPDGQAPTAFFRQTQEGTFNNYTQAVGLDLNSEARFAQLADFSGDREPDLAITTPNASDPSPLRVYDISGEAFRDMTGLLLPDWKDLRRSPMARVTDVVVEDFNNDTHPDILLTVFVNELAGSRVFQWTRELVSADLAVKGGEVGLRFETDGRSVYFNKYLYPELPAARVFIGKDGHHPETFGFTLSPDDPKVAGIMHHVKGEETALYVGYDPLSKIWRAFFSSPENNRIRLLINSDQEIRGLTGIGFGPVDIFKNVVAPVLLMYDPATRRYIDRTKASGLDQPGLCQSAVAGDFDNDRDIDLYLSCNYISHATANKLYENLGNGTFRAVPSAGGAAGVAVGPHYLDFDLGSRLAMADYDNDGFLDLFLGPTVAVGAGDRTAFLGAPPQLFHNHGNENHWIEIELQGVRSNREGIGAEVRATAGGVTQVRSQGGGMHHFAQNHNRLHFGLGVHKRVGQIAIRWPSGITQALSDIPGDQILRVIEPSKPDLLGAPIDVRGAVAGVFLWKDVASGDYQLRVSAGGKAKTFQVKLITSGPFTAVPSSLESNDGWSAGRHGFALVARVGSGADLEDGIRFQLMPGAKTLISVEQDGNANPRQLHVGRMGLPLSPAGWIVSPESLQRGPAPQLGTKLGLWIGRGEAPNVVEARLSGDGLTHHRMRVDLVSMKTLANIAPRKLEAGDTIWKSANAVRLSTKVSTSWDGVDIEVSPGADLGIAYRQDSLFQPRFVTTGIGIGLGPPNAYWIGE